MVVCRPALSALVWLALLALPGCATPHIAAWPADRPLVLLGEVHDHVQAHALRLQAVQRHLAGGARPAIVMEQFDRGQQGAIDRLRADGADAQAIVTAAGGPGWNWDFYRPYVALALQYRLPLVAANVGREEARRVMREGLAATGFEPEVPEAMLAAHAQAIEASHCGQVGGDLARRMALAQVARDQAMARALVPHAARGAVLLAGSGHVRTDIGVPPWLPPALRAQAWAVGVVEQGDATRAFDRRVELPVQPRPDPCAAMRRP
jgi:uncharacterized iron-regulated protein